MRTAALAVIACFCVAPAILPASAQPVCDRIMWEITHGQYARALTQLDGAPANGGTEASRANLRGLTRMLSGDVKRAITDFDTALELDPNMTEARFNRAVALLRTGEYPRASKEFETIYAGSSPLRTRAAYHNALALDAMGKASDALTWLAKAPDVDDALFYSGVLHERAGDLQAAGRAYKTYIERHPDSIGARLRFGICAQRAGSIDVAKTYLESVVKAAPGTQEAAEASKFLVMWE